MANAWWVNQGKSSKRTNDYGIVWAPLLDTSGKAVSHWESMDEAAPGDLVLHYANGAVRGFSVVLAAAVPAGRPYGGEPWREDGRLLAVDYVDFDVPLPRQEIPEQIRVGNHPRHFPFDYRGNANQAYFLRLDFDVAATILDARGAHLDAGEAGDEQQLRINGATDRLGVARFRVEQPYLRAQLLGGRPQAACDICGDPYPSSYLVAGHIKPRSLCSERERRDINVAMLVCLFGCDAAFERGDIRVSDTGQILVSSPAGAASERLARLVGRVAHGFNESRQKYFRDHRARHSRR